MKDVYRKYLKPFNIIKALILVALVAMVINLYENSYEQQINKIRKEKDHSFRTSISSPLADKYNFTGLPYFPPDEKYKVNARLMLINGTPATQIQLSDGKKRTYHSFAKAYFKMDTLEHEVTLYNMLDDHKQSHQLFLPFTDKTSGDATYASGRYLDIVYNQGKTIELDFNQAYHPYCVYNYKYSCPIPPADNYIDASIFAGEKLADQAKE